MICFLSINVERRDKRIDAINGGANILHGWSCECLNKKANTLCFQLTGDLIILSIYCTGQCNAACGVDRDGSFEIFGAVFHPRGNFRLVTEKKRIESYKIIFKTI